ncbi:MAG: hypothetical protein AAF416_11115 [Pseudomonadota bacterium]
MTLRQMTQADAIAFMLDPASHGGKSVEHIETHISHVFLVVAERRVCLGRNL